MNANVRCAVILLALAATRLAGAELAPAGPEQPVDPTPWFSYLPQLAGRPDGSFAVAWERFQGLGPTDTLYLVRTGGPRGHLDEPVELDVTGGIGEIMGLTATARGYTAVWWKRYHPDLEKSCWIEHDCRLATLGRQLAPNGRPTAPRVRLPNGGDAQPRPVGGAIVHWFTWDHVQVLLVDDAGQPLGPVATIKVAGGVYEDFVVQRSTGDFVVLWTSQSFAGRDLGIMAQAFDAHGQPQGRPFVAVPPRHDGFGSFAQAALGADGTLAVLSSNDRIDLGPAEPVELRTFDAAGRLLAGPIRVSSSQQWAVTASVAVDPAGHALVVWMESSDRTFERVAARARLFTRRGAPLGEAVDFASPASTADYPAIGRATAVEAGVGSWWIAWEATVAPESRPGPSQIFVRRLTLIGGEGVEP